MKNLLYFAAGLLGILWAILFIGYRIDGTVHLLLVVAFFILMLRIFNNRKLARDLSFHSQPHASRMFVKKTYQNRKLTNHENEGQ